MGNDWEEHKSTIKRYWILEKMKLKQVAIVMREKHGFDKKPKTYETKFRSWGDEFSKNRRAADWKALGSRVQKRSQQGKKSNVQMYGRMIPEGKCRKAFARYCYESTIDRFAPALSLELPDGMIICTPKNLLDFSALWNGLPWARFQFALHDLMVTSDADQASTRRFFSAFLNIEQNLARLRSRAFLPPSSLCTTGSEVDLSGTSTDSQLRPFLTAIYLMSNHSVGQWYHVIERLDVQTLSFLFRVLGRMKTTTTRVLIERICRYAVEHRLTKLLGLLDADVILDVWDRDTGYPVLIAVWSRHKELATRLIEAGANISQKRGPEILVEMIDKGWDDMIDLLFQNGLEVNARLHVHPYLTHKPTALMVAVMKHKLEVSKRLIELGADVNCELTLESKSSSSTLGIALKRQQLELAQLLHVNGARLSHEEICNPAALLGSPKSPFNGGRPNDVSLVRLLISSGVELNALSQSPDHCGTPLQAAVRRGCDNITKLLIDHGADVNAPVRVVECLLKAAIERCSFEVVELLIHCGAIVNPPLQPDVRSKLEPYKTALGEALDTGSIKIIRLLLDKGADPNTVGEYRSRRQSNLYAAVCQGNVAVTQLLLEAGALVDERNETLITGKGWIEETALYAAVYSSNVALVQMLLQGGADVHALATCSTGLGDYEMSIFEMAAGYPNRDIVRLLLSEFKDLSGDAELYALQAAVRLDDVDLTRTLVEAGANINATVARGAEGTLLHEVVSRCCYAVPGYLLDTGASVTNASGTASRTAVQEALEAMDMHLSNGLITAGPSVNTPAAAEATLRSAIIHNSTELVHMVLQAGANVDEEATREALRLAAELGHTEIFDILLGFNADVNVCTTQDSKDETPLQAASSSGSYEIVARLLAAGASVDAGAADKRGTALQAACRQGHLQIAKLLLRWKADINAISEMTDYGTALHEAIMGRHFELAEFLLNEQADPNIPGPIHRTRDGYLGTPLQSALEEENLHSARLLVKAGARADISTEDNPDIISPLEVAIQRGSNEALELVLSVGADVNLPGDYFLGGTAFYERWCSGPALVAAAERANAGLVRALIKAKADVNASAEVIDRCRKTDGFLVPLQAAALTSDSEIIHLLLDAGADASIESNFPYYEEGHNTDTMLRSGSLLAVAIRKGHSKKGAIDRLIQCGAAINVPADGYLGRTALQEAATQGHKELVEKLLQLGADVNAPPSAESGGTALQLAAIQGYAEIVSLLLDEGADPFADGAASRGRTALEGAAEFGRTDLVQLLLNIGDTMGLPGYKYEKARDLALNRLEVVIANMIMTAITNATTSE